MSYGPEDCLHDLKRVWEGTASEAEQADLDFFLLELIQRLGSQGVTEMLRAFPSDHFGTMTVSESGAEVLHTVVRDDRRPLTISTFVDSDMAWVNVLVESAPTTSAEDDPRHAAFYSVWEKLIQDGVSSPKESETADRAVFLVGLLESEVMNGGLGQYLTNTDGVYLSETIACLERIGAGKTRELLLAAAELGAQAESYVAAWDDESEAYSRLDDEFCDSGEDLAGLTTDRFLGI